MTQKPVSNEYLETLWETARKLLPGWQYAMLRRHALPVSGGRANARVDEPSVLEKVALQEITPSTLSRLPDEELGLVWLRLNQWFVNAKKRKQAIENIVNAAAWTKTELERRGRNVDESALTEAVAQLEDIVKERKASVSGTPTTLPRHLARVLDKAPEEVLLVRDFASIAGSAAVSEKPGDIDVVIRAPYDLEKGSFGLDGSALWVALRRFMSPDKDGPQIQVLGSPTGSFTDYVPVFDLVARKRAFGVVKIEPTPAHYADRDRVIKADGASGRPAQAAAPAEREQAERAKREDKVTPGEFFFQPKPTRAAQEGEPQTVEGLVRLYQERAGDWLPAFVQKKYDGARHQIHKIGDRVVILSEDGEVNTERFPGVVKAVLALPAEKAVLDAEFEIWDRGEHLPREAMSGYMASRSNPDDSKVVANIFDVLFWDEDLHGKPLNERLEFLKRIKVQSTMKAPNPDERLNVAPGILAETPDEVHELAEGIRTLPGSEGVVIKQARGAYPLDVVTPDAWVKFHNATTLRTVVTKRDRLKGGAFHYEFAIRPGKEKPLVVTDGRLVPVGTSFSTSKIFNPGDRLLIESEQVNRETHPGGVVISAWVPRVLGTYEGAPDDVGEVVRRAAENLVLRSKLMNEKGEVEEYFPANVIKVLKPEVPSIGPKRAKVAFVGASPGKVDVARGEPLTGPAGETFNEIYLKPLGLKRAEVFLTNSVPLYLTNSDGTVREPTVEEVKTWEDWLSAELDAAEPEVIVALGRTAQSALDQRSDLVLPHPSAIRRFGDSGEVSRKLRRLKDLIGKRVTKQGPAEEDETRTEQAVQNWSERWQNMIPRSGEGRFVYQHHWRGLTEDETKLTDEELMRGDHSIHGDLRFEGDDGLWGFTAFLGLTSDNRGPNFDKLIDFKRGDNIEAGPKLLQPKQWLEVGVGNPYISPPGGVGATSGKFSKFFERDRGTYRLGAARLHMVEIFLDGNKLSGRYLLTFAPVAGRRRWLIDKPDDQTPMSESRDLADVIGELRRKGQRFLFWSKPGERPRLIDVKTGRDVERKSLDTVRIIKADNLKKIVYGVVLDPYGNQGKPEVDAHGDWPPPSVVEKTAHNWLKKSRAIGLQHLGKANAVPVESWIEPYPSREDYLAAMQDRDHSIFRRQFGDDFLHSGAWVLGVELGPDEWKAFENGEINAFSPGGFGVKEPIKRSSFPKVRIRNLVPEVEQ